MPPNPHVPDALRQGPFRSADALRHGLSRRQLQSGVWRQVLHDVYVWAETPDDLPGRLTAAALVLPPSGAFSHHTAAWLLGADLFDPQHHMPTVTVPRECHVGPRSQLVLRRAALPDADVTRRSAWRCTAPLRTAFDLARSQALVEAVVCVDAMLHLGLVGREELAGYVAEHPGWRGVRRAAAALDHADGGAESPMESRLRLLLVLAGLPRPIVNEPLYGRAGDFLARPDLRIDHVLIEFDGSVHREADVFASDLRRQNRLTEAGYVVLRYSATDVYNRPHRVVHQIRTTLQRPSAASILTKSTQPRAAIG
jgi:hypothetical protein